jgi:UDP-N-acetylmuramoyl-tripeptide--D-alanyl-D-alanine ligase
MTNAASFTYGDLQIIAGSAAAHLPRSLAVTGVSTDTRTLAAGNVFVALRGEYLDGHDHVQTAVDKGAALVVVDTDYDVDAFVLATPSAPPFVAVASPLQCLGSFAWHHRRRFQIPVVAIAGAAGKTSTKDLTAHVLQSSLRVLKTEANYNNQIGTPLTLLQLTHEHEVAVIEIGTNEPGEIELLCAMVQPTIGLITNIGKEHLEKLIDLDGVEREETALFDWLRDHNGLALVNVDDERLAKYAPTFIRCITFGIDSGAEIHPHVSFDNEVRPILHLVHGTFTLRAHMQAVGLAAAYNATCALAVAWALQLHAADVQKALMSYQPVQGHGYARMVVEQYGAMTVLNDCYNANPESMVMALRTLQHYPATKRIAVLGDMRELGLAAREEHVHILTEASTRCDLVLVVGDEFREAAELVDLPHVIAHQTHHGCAEELQQLNHDGVVVLVKGSRGMRMETILTELEH